MKKNMYKYRLYAVAAVLLALCCLCLAACGGKETEEESIGDWVDYTWNYTDVDGNSAELMYAVYVPASYTGTESYPLITYMPDSAYVLKISQSTLDKTKKGEGPVNWINEERMARDPVFYLVFGFISGPGDITEEGSEGAQIVPIIDKVVAEYGMNTKRLYLTGQSMGGIADFALNDAYPDKFAATVYVGCQPGGAVGDETYWDIINRGRFADQKWIYIASRLDEKAPFGQDDVQAKLDEMGVDYELLYGLDHKDLAATSDIIKEVLDRGCDHNFFGFEQVTSNGNGSAEHMQSFRYCYSIDSIYDWLMSQSL